MKRSSGNAWKFFRVGLAFFFAVTAVDPLYAGNLPAVSSPIIPVALPAADLLLKGLKIFPQDPLKFEIDNQPPFFFPGVGQVKVAEVKKQFWDTIYITPIDSIKDLRK